VCVYVCVCVRVCVYVYVCEGIRALLSVWLQCIMDNAWSNRAETKPYPHQNHTIISLALGRNSHPSIVSWGQRP